MNDIYMYIYERIIWMDGWMHRIDGWMFEPYLILDTDRKEEGEKLFASFQKLLYTK